GVLSEDRGSGPSAASLPSRDRTARLSHGTPVRIAATLDAGCPEWHEASMSSALLVRQARIVSEDSPDFREADVLVTDGVIRAIGHGLAAPEGARTIEARGRLLMPAMFDAHVHFREPGFEA